jgi:hypothetical protein
VLCQKFLTSLSKGADMPKSDVTNSTEEKQHAGDLLRCWIVRTGLRRDSFLAKLATTTGQIVSLHSLNQWLAKSHSRSLPLDPDLHLALIKFFYLQKVITLEETKRYLQLCDFPGYRYPDVGAIFLDQAILNPYQRDRVMRMFFPDTVDQRFQDLEDDLVCKLGEMYPAYLMDQYWFIRAVNRYALALLEFEEKDLEFWESWHVVAMKFKPELKVRERRGPDARKYYLLSVRKFREDTQILATTARYRNLFTQLERAKGFRKVWQDAKNTPEYAPVARYMTNPEAHLSDGTIIRSTVHISEIKYGSGISQFFHLWTPGKDSFYAYKKVQEQAETQYSRPYYQITDYIDPVKLMAVGGL